jgi:hypothetical protein
VRVLAGAGTTELIGELVELVYARVDADGGLRDARVVQSAVEREGRAAGSASLRLRRG